MASDSRVPENTAAPEDIIRRAREVAPNLKGLTDHAEQNGRDLVGLRTEDARALASALDVLLAERQQDKERVRQLVEALEGRAVDPCIYTVSGAASCPTAWPSEPDQWCASCFARGTLAAVHEPAPLSNLGRDHAADATADEVTSTDRMRSGGGIEGGDSGRVHADSPSPVPAPPPASEFEDALERTDQALRAVLAGKPVRDADEILSANAWLLFAVPAPPPAPRCPERSKEGAQCIHPKGHEGDHLAKDATSYHSWPVVPASPPTPGFWPGDAQCGVPGVTDRKEIGNIGAGTPHARMQWFWDRMGPHEKLIEELTGWSELSSTYRFEAAVADAFDKLARDPSAPPQETAE
jgi:ribosomal protein L12E/L44/L45/RPP1/RPP2